MSETIIEYTPDVIESIRTGEKPSENVEEVEQEETPKISKYEEQARSEGWTDLDEWADRGKDPNDWVDAGEFVRRGELMNRIKGQTKAIKSSHKRIEDLEKAIKTLGEHNKQIAKVEYAKARKDLQRQKLEAIEDRDHETVLDIDDQIAELDSKATALDAEEETTSETTTEQEFELPTEVNAWVQNPDNEWYSKDPVMRAEADRVAQLYGLQNFDKDLPPEDQPWGDLLDYIDQYIHSKFSHKFDDTDEEDEEESTPAKTKGRRKPTVAEPGQQGARSRRSKKTKLTVADLSEEEKAAYTEFVTRQKIMTADEYLTQLEEIKSN